MQFGIYLFSGVIINNNLDSLFLLRLLYQSQTNTLILLNVLNMHIWLIIFKLILGLIKTIYIVYKIY